MCVDPSINITTSKDGFYLKREIHPWEDLIRLNFDNLNKKETLKAQCDKYMDWVMDHFDGLRLDNLHNTHPEA